MCTCVHIYQIQSGLTFEIPCTQDSVKRKGFTQNGFRHQTDGYTLLFSTMESEEPEDRTEQGFFCIGSKLTPSYTTVDFSEYNNVEKWDHLWQKKAEELDISEFFPILLTIFG